MIRYVEIMDKENPQKPKGENIAKALDAEINSIEGEIGCRFVMFTFLGEKEVFDEEEENSLFMYAVEHDKVWTFMLYFS